MGERNMNVEKGSRQEEAVVVRYRLFVANHQVSRFLHLPFPHIPFSTYL